MATAFVYMFKASESLNNLENLYNNLPDGVIVLDTVSVPKETYRDNDDVRIVTGDIGAIHYNLLNWNQQTDIFFNVNLSS